MNRYAASRKFAGLGLVLFGITGLVWSQDRDKKAGEKTAQGRIEKRTYDFKEAGKEMEYALYVPKSYVKGKKTPLMVALHGLKSNPQQILRYPGFTSLAEKHGYILVAPMGYNSQGWYGANGPRSPASPGTIILLGATAYFSNSNPENLGELSEKDVMNVLALVRKDFTIDEKRIYLMGHSMGGGGTWHLGLKHPDVWAGLAPIAPAIFRKASVVEKIKHIPVILVQGDKDKLVPVAGARRWAEEMKKQNMTYEYIEVPGGGHVDVAFQNLGKIFEFFEKQKKREKQ